MKRQLAIAALVPEPRCGGALPGRCRELVEPGERQTTLRTLCAAAVLMLSVVGCGAGSDVGRASDATSTIDDTDDVSAARELWSTTETDGYRLTVEGEVGGQSASVEVTVADGDELTRSGFPETGDFSVEGIFDRFDEAFASGAAASGSYDRQRGFPVDIELDEAGDQPGLDVRVVNFQLLERPDGCDAPDGSILDIDAEPIEYQIFNDARRFADASGCIVRLDVAQLFNGSSFCNWESLRYVVIGDRTSTVTGDDPVDLSDGHRTYVFDPNDVLADFDDIDRSQTLEISELSASVKATGLNAEDGELWLDSDDTGDAYLVKDGVARRMVLDADKAILCE